MGRQESPQLIERKGQVDADTQETSRASKYCRQVISIPVSLCFKKMCGLSKYKSKDNILETLFKRRYSSQMYWPRLFVRTSTEESKYKRTGRDTDCAENKR